MNTIRMSEVRAKFPMYSDLSDDQLLIGLRNKFYPDIAPADFYGRIERDTERERLMRDSVASMSPSDRVAANWSAGYGNLAQGLQQLAGKAGIGPGVRDEDIRDKRERDRYLAEGTSGGKALQIASEVLPSMAVPGAAYGRAVQALPYVAKTGPVTQLLAAGAAGGAAGAALSPTTEDESRAANMAIAGTVGAVIPGAGATVAPTLRGARKLLTEGGATTRAVEAIAEPIPRQRVIELAERLRYGAPMPTVRGKAVDVPSSAAQASGDPYLAQGEAFSRSRPSTQPNWAAFDTAQNAQRFDVLQRMTPSDLRLERLDRVRAGRTGPMRDQALAEAAAAPDFAGPVTRSAKELLEGASGANPAVQTVARYVARELGEDAGGVVTPARLYEVRKVLAAKLSGPSAIGDELSAAAKGAQRETRAMIASIDDALDSASSGKWSPYLREYSERSQPITSGRAQRDALEKIERKPLRGNTPEVTAAGYGSAMRQATEGKFGDKLTDTARTDADAFLDHLRQAEAASRTRKGAATMGGGSITNTDQQLAGLTLRVIEALPGVGGYAKRIGDYNRDAVEREMARLLQSPGELGSALRALPDGQRQRVLDEALRASGLSGAAATTP